MYLHIPLFVPSWTILYHLVPSCTTLYCAGTRQYIPVHTSMYCHRNYLCCQWYVLVCTILRFLVRPGCLVSSKVHTGSYQYIPSCTALYQVYRIPDVCQKMCLRYSILYAPTMSYVHHLRHSMYFWTYDIIYNKPGFLVTYDIVCTW
jgi:hypothetical protein